MTEVVVVGFPPDFAQPHTSDVHARTQVTAKADHLDTVVPTGILVLIGDHNLGTSSEGSAALTLEWNRDHQWIELE